MEQEEQPTFESERIQELKNERLYLQKKIFTKWMNTFLQDDSKVDDLFEDLSDGRVLIRLLESISNERVGRIARGKQRIHKLENVSKALTFLQKSVKLESIGPEDVVDGKQDLILGLIWMIILRFQISKVENESGSQDAKSAKEALLLWCQRKTKGYSGVDIKNFTTSWKNGLAFNALIHKHRPDLLNFSKLHSQQHRFNLSTAFDIAEQKLGVGKILDPEDLDNPRLDEKSVMTYVSMLYQCFAKMKHEETGGKRVAKIVDVMMELDKMKKKYTNMVQELLAWIAMKIESLDADVPKTNSLLQKSLVEFKALRFGEKPRKFKERANIEELFFVIQTKSNAYRLRPYCPPVGRGLKDINSAWQKLEKGEHLREVRLREELARQEKLSQLVERFEKKANLRESWLDDMLAVVETEERSKSLQVSDASVALKRHEALEMDVKAREIKIKSVTDICQELSRQMSEGFHDIQARKEQVSRKWNNLLERLQKRRVFLVTLCDVTPVVSEIEKLCSQLKEIEINMSAEESRKDHSTVEEQLQKHKLLETQLNSHRGQIQQITSSSSELIQNQHPQSPLIQEKLRQLTKNFEDVSGSATYRRERLDELKDFHLFKETVKKENAFIQEKAQLAASREVGKDLISLTRLQKKVQGLEAEIHACEVRCNTVCQQGYKMISEKNSSADEIQSIIDGLQASIDNLKSQAWIRAERLLEASQSFQYYSDANEVESWIAEHMQLLASEDFGKDKETAKSLLQRHRQISEEIIAFKEDMVMLQDECKQIEETDNKAEQRTEEPPSKQTDGDEIEVETETEDEEPVEKEVEQKVIKEIKVPQVMAKYAYVGDGLSMKKGELFYLAAKTNDDWWSVRRVSNKESGYVPATYVKEVEPKIFRKTVLEKVKIVENVKVKKKKMKRVKVERKSKEKSIDKRAKRTSSILRRSNKKRERKPRFTQHFDRENVTTRHLAIVISYSKLKTAAEERGIKLSEALKFFDFCSVYDQVMAWIEDQIRYLDRWTSFTENIDFETIKMLLERTDREISANEKLYKEVEQKGRDIIRRGTSQYTDDVKKRLDSMLQRYRELEMIKESREKDLIKSHGVEMFSKLCNEVKSWIVEKSNQISETPVGKDQEMIRILQKKHQNFELEVIAIGDKVKQLKADSTSLRNTQPKTLTEILSKEKEVYVCWEMLMTKAAARKAMLQEAYGYQGFLADYRDMVVWAKDASNRFSQKDLPKDLSVLIDLLNVHNEASLEMKANLQRITDLIKSGQALMSKSVNSEDVHGLIDELSMLQKTVPDLWQAREIQLSCCKKALMFYADTDSFISRTAIVQKLLTTEDTGASMENVTTLLKQIEQISQKVAQLEERLKKIVGNADEMIEKGHYNSSMISTKKDEAITSLDKIQNLLQQRKRALQQSQEFQQFRADVKEFLSWAEEKLALANDESYKDPSSLQSKVLKHQALQAEIISNAVSKKRLEQTGEDMIAEEHVSSEEIKDLLQDLDDNWDQLERGARVKQEHLDQATKARAFSSAADDFEMWCDQTKALLSSKDYGDDLAAVRFLRNKHQLTEKDIKQHQEDLNYLHQEAQHMREDGNFRSNAIITQLADMKNRMVDVINASKSRGLALDDSYLMQQFLFEVNVQLSWIDDHLAQIENAEYGTNLTDTQRLFSRHEAVETELRSHSAIILKLVQKGNELVETRIGYKKNALKACENLEQSLKKLQEVSDNRRQRILADREAFQFLLDANEIENWLEEKRVHISGLQQGKDLDSAERQLSKANNLIEEFKRNTRNIEAFVERSTAFDDQNNPRNGLVLQKCQQIAKEEKSLFGVLQKSQTKLENLHKVYQFFYDAENMREWLSEKLKVAGAEGYGKDFEHWQILTEKFDDLKVSIAAGKTAYDAVIRLADDVIATKVPHATSVLNAKNKLSAMWSRLMEKMKQKNARLTKAGGLHKFNMQVNDILSNLKEKEDTITVKDLGEDVVSSESKVRSHDTALLAIEAVGKQIEEIDLTGNELVRSYPGKTAEQIQMHQSYVKKVWADVLRKAKNNKGKLHGNVDYHRLNSEIARLLLWCQETTEVLNTDESLQTVDEVEEAMDKMDDLKLEIDGKEDKFAYVVQAGEQMVEEGHHATEEIQEKLEELLTCHDQVHDSWLLRRQHLTELYDYAMFVREVKRIDRVISSYQNFLNSVSAGNSDAGSEIEPMMKRIQKLKNMMDSQTAKIETALELGNQLLKDKHFAADEVKDLSDSLTTKRDAFSAELADKERFLKDALDLAQFRQENDEIHSWINEKLSDIRNRKIEASNLGLFSTIHKSDLVELKSYNAAKETLRNRGENMVAAEHFASGEVEDCLLELYRQFELLEKDVNAMGTILANTKFLAALKGDVDFAEAHIIEKERSLATDETGDNYDRCQILIRQLENTAKDMKADEGRIQSINEKATRLRSFNPSELLEETTIHLRMLNSRWENLKELAASRRSILDKASKFHLFKRDAEEIESRMGEKITKLMDCSIATDLGGVQVQMRRHMQLESDLEAIELSLEKLDSDALGITGESPDSITEVQDIQAGIIEVWETMIELNEERQAKLQAAEHLYRFQTDVSSLSSWMKKVRERLSNISQSRNVKETKAMLDMHKQIVSALAVREEVFARVKEYGHTLAEDGSLEPSDVFPKLDHLDQEKEELLQILQKKKIMLKESFDLQRFGSELEQIEGWLDRRKDALDSHDFSMTQENVERMLIQHNNMKDMIRKFQETMDSLRSFADEMGRNDSVESINMSERYQRLSFRLNEAKGQIESKLSKLQDSLMYIKFLSKSNDIMSWAKQKLEYAVQDALDVTGNLQSERKIFDGVQAEMVANKKKKDDIMAEANALLQEDIRSQDVELLAKRLSDLWDDLERELANKGKSLGERMTLERVEASLREIHTWLERSAATLRNGSLGKSLESSTVLQTKHGEIENEIMNKGKQLRKLDEMVDNNVEINKPLCGRLRDEYDDICKRFVELQNISRQRKQDLIFSVQFHSLSQEADDELNWIKEKAVYLDSSNFGTDLTDAKHIFKKHQMLDSEITGHENITLKLLKKLGNVSAETNFKKEFESIAESLNQEWVKLKKLSQQQGEKIRENIYFLKYNADVKQATSWLKDNLSALRSDDFGKDESSAAVLLRKVSVQENNLEAFRKTIDQLQSRMQVVVESEVPTEERKEMAAKIQQNLNTEYSLVIDACASRKTRLKEIIQLHRFNRVADVTNAWIEEKSPTADSKDYGETLKQTLALLKTFEEFIADMKSYELEVAKIQDMISHVDFTGHSDLKAMENKAMVVKKNFTALEAASLNRLKALNNTKRVREFSEMAQDVLQWINRKENDVIKVDWNTGLLTLVDLRKKHDAFMLDLHALSSKASELHEAYSTLQHEIPDEAASAEEEMQLLGRKMQSLSETAQFTSEKLSKAEELKTFLQTSEDLRVWIGDRTAAIKSNSRNVVSKAMDHDDAYLAYRDHLTERDARKTRVDGLMKEGETICGEVLEIKAIVENETENLRKDWQNLNLELEGFHEDLKHTRDSESLKDDLVNLDKWIVMTGETFEDVEGSSLDDVEELLRNQDDLEKSIAVQEERFQSTLGKLTKYTEKFGNMYAKRHSLGKESPRSYVQLDFDNRTHKDTNDLTQREPKVPLLKDTIQEETENESRLVNDEKAFEYTKGFNSNKIGNAKESINNASVEPKIKKINERGKGKHAADSHLQDASTGRSKSSEDDAVDVVSNTEKHQDLDHDLLDIAKADHGSSGSDAGSLLASTKFQGVGKGPMEVKKVDADSLQIDARELISVHDTTDLAEGRSLPPGDGAFPVVEEEEVAFRETIQTESNPFILDSAPECSIVEYRTMKHQDDPIMADNIFNSFASEPFDENMNKSLGPNGSTRGPDSRTEFVDADVNEDTIEFVFEQPVEGSDLDVFSLLDEMDISEGAPVSFSKFGSNDVGQSTEKAPFHQENDGSNERLETFKAVGIPITEGEVVSNNHIVFEINSEQKNPDVQLPTFGMGGGFDLQLPVPRQGSPETEDVIDLPIASESTRTPDFATVGLVDYSLDGPVSPGSISSSKPYGMESESPLTDTQQRSEKESLSTETSITQGAQKMTADDAKPPNIPVILVSRPSKTDEELRGSGIDKKFKFNAIDFAGHLEFKETEAPRGVRLSMKKWKEFYAVISDSFLMLYRSETAFKHKNSPLKEHLLEDVMISVEAPGQSVDHLLRLQFPDRTNYLITSPDQEVLDDFLMAVTECTEMNSKEDTVSLPPAPPPPQLPIDVVQGNDMTSKPPQLPIDVVQRTEMTSHYSTEQEQNETLPSPDWPSKTNADFATADSGAREIEQDAMTEQTESKTFPNTGADLFKFKQVMVPDPVLSSEESDEFDDVIPPPAPVLSVPSAAQHDSRKMSLGILDIVGISTAFSDNSSDEDDDGESRESSTFDPDSLGKNEVVQEEKPPRKISNMNKWFSRVVEDSFADETTPITPFGEDTDPFDFENEFTTGDLSQAPGFRPKVGSVGAEKEESTEAPTNVRPKTLDFPAPQSSHQKYTVEKSPVSSGKELKKKGFLGGIFKKRK